MDNGGESQVLAYDAVFLGRNEATMNAAIDFVGGELARRGVVGQAYVASMKERELVVSTYLGNGVALPHGTLAAKDEISGTAIVVGQYPQGVPWGDETAYLVIGLAASGDDHVHVLSQIADVLQDEELCRELWTTADHDFVYESLTGVEENGAGDSASRDITIANPAGLHARPAAEIVGLVGESTSDVEIVKNGMRASGGSIMSVLALGATTGDLVTVVATGPDAADVVERIAGIMLARE